MHLKPLLVVVEVDPAANVKTNHTSRPWAINTATLEAATARSSIIT